MFECLNIWEKWFIFTFQNGAKGVVCYYDGTTVQLKSFANERDGQPILKPLPKGYTLEKAYKTENDSVICKFSRSITVPTESEKLMYDLNSPLYTLKAYGVYNAGKKQIEYHRNDGGHASISSKAVQIVPVSVPVSSTTRWPLVKKSLF